MQQDPCPVCNGGGKVDSKEGKPWAVVTARSNPEVRAGTVTSRDCTACKGTGLKNPPESADPAAAVAAPDMHAIPAKSLATGTQPAAAMGTLPAPQEGGKAAKRPGAGQGKGGDN